VRKWLGKELVMPKKRFSAEQIVMLLRQIEVSMAQGNPALEACREAGISQQNYAMSC
jgi:putative transposase